MTNRARSAPARIKLDWPIPFAGLRGVKRRDIATEISSGITLAALIIPLNVGYAQVAGLPATMGLYAAIVPLIFFALFTSSRHVISGPGPATAVLIAAALASFAAPGDPLRAQYAVALALMCSGLFFLAWVFRLAFLQNFLSRAVLIGFVTGLGVQVFTNQLRKILGVSIDVRRDLEEIGAQLEQSFGITIQTQGYFLEVSAMMQEIPHANLYAVALGVSTLVGARLFKRFAPGIPGGLLMLILMTIVVVVFDLEKAGVNVLGALPAGLPVFALPEVPLTDYLKLLPGAMAVVVISLSGGLLLVQKYAQKHEYHANGNQMLFAYGISSAAAGLSGCMISGNSASCSAAMDSSGAKSQLTSLVAAFVVGLILLFFTDYLALMPVAVLAGLIANSVLSLIDVANMRGLYGIRRSEFWVAAICLLAVLVLGPLKAVMIAFAFSVIDVLRRSSKPNTMELHEAAHGRYFISADHDDGISTPGLIVYRFMAPIFFANANILSEEIQRLVTQSKVPVKWFVLDASASYDMDTTGAETLRRILVQLANKNVTFAITRADNSLQQVLEGYGLIDQIGENRLFATNREAIAVFREQEAEGYLAGSRSVQQE